VLPIHLPPLRDRVEDIPALSEHFLRLTAQREGKAVKTISPEAITAMQTYSWPGNVRELQNVCERAAVLCKAATIERSLIEPWLVAAEGMSPVALVNVAAGLNGHASPASISTIGSAIVEHKPASDGVGGFVAVDGRALDEIERDAIVRTLTRFNGHRQRTAQALGIGVRTLGLKLKKWKELQLVEQTL
jgi:DNA-binding NtrC family response regulator